MVQNINHRIGIPIGDVAVEFVETPFVPAGAPFAGIAFEFINADGFREICRKPERNGLQYRLDDTFGHAVFSCDLSL